MSYRFVDEAPTLTPLNYVEEEEMVDVDEPTPDEDRTSSTDKDMFPFLIPILPVVN